MINTRAPDGANNSVAILGHFKPQTKQWCGYSGTFSAPDKMGEIGRTRVLLYNKNTIGSHEAVVQLTVGISC